MLGMILNLFASIPFDTINIKSGSFLEKTGLALGYARTSGVLALQLHWLNASVLILLSIVLIILGLKAHKKILWILAILLCVIFSVATISGGAFIAYAANDYYSFSMATAFIVATVISIWLLFSAFSRRFGLAKEGKMDDPTALSHYQE